nr:hypothetical protein [Tanacetum cinerariifolium]
IPTDPCHTPTIIQPSTRPQNKQQPRKPKIKDTWVRQSSDPIENVLDEVVHKQLGDGLVRAATTASSLEVEQDIARVESSSNEEILGEDASKQGRINAINADEEITLPMKRKDQIKLDEEAVLKLQAAFDEKERLVREKAKKVGEANISLIETWDDIQAKIDADHQLTERMQAQEQEEKPKIKDTRVRQSSDPIENVLDEVVHKQLGDGLVRPATTASSLEAEQDIGNTLQSDGDSLKLDELMALCTTLQNRVIDLEKIVITQPRVESSSNEEILGEDASKQGRINAINADEEITLVNVQDEVVSNDADKEMFDVDVLEGEEVFVVEHKVVVKRVNDEVNVVEEVFEVINTAKLIIDAAQDSVAGDIVSIASAATIVSAATITTVIIITVGDITLAQALKEIKSKGILIELVIEPVKPMKRKDQIRLDEEAVLKLQAAFDEKERLVREKAKKVGEATISLIETWDDIQAKIDADHQLAERMQAQEQEELFIIEKATLFQQLLEKRRKHFAAKRAE